MFSFWRSQTEALSNTDLFVDLSFVQTVYLFPPKVSITIQAPERSVRVTALGTILRSLSKTRNWHEYMGCINVLKTFLIPHVLQNIYSLYTVCEEVRFVCLHNDNIKEVSPVLSHHVRHPFIPVHKEKETNRYQIATEQFIMSQSGVTKTRATESVHLHKAKGTVGDEKELLSIVDQSMQNCMSLFASQNELIYEENWDRMLLRVRQCDGLMQEEERDFLPRSSMTHLYM